MKKETLNSLTEAHGWLGIIISGVLMIVFACGTASFFRNNIIAWDKYYNPDKVLEESAPKLEQVSEYLQQNYSGFLHDHPVFIGMPREDIPYYRISFKIEKDVENEDIRLYLDPETITPVEYNPDQYYLGNMLYQLHINLLLPFGRELVGIVSLIFFVILLSGILIHLRHIVSYFYLYRFRKPRETYLDGHNLIGVTAIPYTFLYALTGIMFNLSIVFQAGFGFAVFQGDIDRLTEIAGFSSPPAIEESGEAMRLDTLEAIYLDAQARYLDIKPNFFRIQGFGDKNAVVSVAFDDHHRFISRGTLVYQVEDQLLLDHFLPNENAFMGTFSILEKLHFGYFGGITMQFAYFLLGLGCCYLILSGNLIWLEKREAKRRQSRIGLRVVKSLTLALSTGTLIAIGASFVATRFAPSEFLRADFLVYIFYAAWFITLLHGCIINPARKAMLQQLTVCVGLFSLCPLYDLVQFLMSAGEAGSDRIDVLLVNIVLSLFAVFSYILKRQHTRRHSVVQDQALYNA